ncbi:hypothetical protein [Shewanella putrefaciens]
MFKRFYVNLFCLRHYLSTDIISFPLFSLSSHYFDLCILLASQKHYNHL